MELVEAVFEGYEPPGLKLGGSFINLQPAGVTAIAKGGAWGTYPADCSFVPLKWAGLSAGRLTTSPIGSVCRQREESYIFGVRGKACLLQDSSGTV